MMAGLSMVGPFTIDAVFPAFEAMSRDLSVDRVAMQQTISVYLVTFAVASLFHGSLSDAVGRKPVVVVGSLLFAVTSAVAAVAPTMHLLLVARGLQGLVAGAGMIVGRTMVRDLFDGVHAQRFMSHISFVFAVAPALAPIAGGWILGWSSWRTIFWVLAAYGLALVLLTAFLLPETHPRSLRVPFRPAPLLGAFRSAATDRAVLRMSAAIAFNFAGLFVYIASAPAIVVDHLGLGAQDFGLLFLPIVGSMMVGSFVTGRLVGRVRAGVFVLSGFLISLSGAAAAAGYHLVVREPSIWGVLVPLATGALGVALVFPILTTGLLDLRPRERGSVSSFQAFSSTCLNALVAGVVSPLVSASLLVLGVVAGAFTVVALGLWAWHRRIMRADRLPAAHVGREPSAPLSPLSRS
jgi:DHA1 family bicyclomycin/chloramphenicol resistance-like MFS transporter